MMKTLLLTCLAANVLLASPAAAQTADETALVRTTTADLRRAGVSLEGPCGAFTIAHRVAWALRHERAGLLRKLSGTQPDGPSTSPTGCWHGGRLFSGDIVIYPDGRHFDMLEDSGTTNGPAWRLELCATIFPGCPVVGEPFRRPQDYVSVVEVGAPAELVTAPPVVVPPVTTTPPATDLAELKALLVDVGDRVTFLSDKVDTVAAQAKADRAETQRQIDQIKKTEKSLPLILKILSLGLAR